MAVSDNVRFGDLFPPCIICHVRLYKPHWPVVRSVPPLRPWGVVAAAQGHKYTWLEHYCRSAGRPLHTSALSALLMTEVNSFVIMILFYNQLASYRRLFLLGEHMNIVPRLCLGNNISHVLSLGNNSLYESSWLWNNTTLYPLTWPLNIWVIVNYTAA